MIACSQIKRLVTAGISAILILYLIIQAIPRPAFAFSIEAGRFALHSDRPIGEAERAALIEAGKRITECEFDDATMRHPVYLCHDATRFRIFAPMNTGALGITNTFGNSFVQPRTKRSLASLITHERVHAMLAKRYGRFWNLRTPEWMQEGVCEYIAGDLSYGVEAGKAMLIAGQSDDSASFRYFKHWFAVRFLVEIEGLTLAQVFEVRRSETDVLRAAVEELRREQQSHKKEKPTDRNP